MPETGAIFVATGAEHYAALAGRAAESLRRHMPGLAIDLYSDRQHDLPVFDRIHVLHEAWERSKIDALRMSRFERTLYLDSDVIVLADIEDIFDVLDRFDIALAQDQTANGPKGELVWKTRVPKTFPQYNSGVIAFRSSGPVHQLFKEWRQAVQEHASGRDQPSLQELLWKSDLRIATLPEQYNLMYPEVMRGWSLNFSAPRILHAPQLHRDFERYSSAADPVEERLGLRLANRLYFLLRADKDLARRRGEKAVRPDRAERFQRMFWQLRRWPARIGRRLLREAGR